MGDDFLASSQEALDQLGLPHDHNVRSSAYRVGVKICRVAAAKAIWPGVDDAKRLLWEHFRLCSDHIPEKTFSRSEPDLRTL
jgi:hypothetical protein